MWIHGLKHPPFAKIRLKELNSVSPNGKLVDDDQDYLPASHFCDRIRLLNVIKSCGREKNIWKVRRIHDIIIEKRLIVKDAYIATALITTYAKCGVMEKAREVFDQIQSRDVVSWNALMAGHVEHGNSEETLLCFRYMQEEDLAPNDVSYVCVLKSCCIMKDMDFGRGLHLEIVKKGLVECNTLIGIWNIRKMQRGVDLQIVDYLSARHASLSGNCEKLTSWVGTIIKECLLSTL